MRSLILALLIVAVSMNSFAASWRSNGNGYYPDAKPPTKWSPESNVIWKTKMPKWSNSSPVISDDRIFICSEPSTLHCLSKQDGTSLWQATHPYESFLTEEQQEEARRLAPKIKTLQPRVNALSSELRELRKIKDPAERKAAEARIREELDPLKNELAKAQKFDPPQTHGAQGYSTPTPACNGKYVVVLFGNGTAACHTVDGAKMWAKRLGRPAHQWGHSTSPVIVGNKAIFQVNDVHALDIQTGKELWRVPGKQAFGSIVHASVNAKDLIVTSEGKVIAASDGKVLAEGLHRLAYSTPIVVDGVAYFIEHGGKAFKLATEEGEKPDSIWKTEPSKDRYYGSPVLHEGLLYAVTQKGDFSVIDAATGDVIHARKLKTKGTHYTSPTFAGGYIFIGTEQGDVAVLTPGKEPKDVALNRLEKLRSCPVFEGSRMYVRGLEHLYCIGEK